MSSTRPSRSASIPIPRSSASPIYNIDSVLSIPFVAPGPVSPRSRQQQPFPQRASVDDGRGHLAARGSPALAASPGRSVPRSVMQPGSSFHGRVVSGTPSSAHAAATAIRTFEPRVVRGTPGSVDASRNTDNACLPSTSAPSSSRMRRPSAAGSSRAPSAQRSSQVFSTSPPPSHPMPFPRPAYLEHSALRHLLQTEASPAFPASRKIDPSLSSATGIYDYSHPLVHTSAMSPPTDSDEESNVSPPRELPSTSRTITYPPQQMLKLPTRWDEQFRNSLLSVSSDGRDLTFHGVSCAGDRDAAAARTSCPIPPACGIYYYEVEIVSKGQKGHISIGFAARDVKLSRLPGWEANSWGYHGDDGYSFAAEKNGTPYGPTFGTGDIIGCGVDFSTYKAFFTKNGSLIGHVFDNIGKDVDLYPSVGMRHTSEAIRVNFGQDLFKYDIDYHVQQQRNTVWSKILTTTLDTSLLDGPRLLPDGSSKDGATISYESKPKVPLSTEQIKALLNRLVVSYLAHHGYAKTVRAFKAQQSSFEKSQPAEKSEAESSRDVDMESVSVERTDSYDIERRTQIVNSVVTGDVDYAIAQTKLHYPAVLEADEGLIHFKLRCRKFVELILEAAELKKKLRNRTIENESAADEMDGIYEDGMNMDVDDDASVPQPAVTNGFGDPAPVVSEAQPENSAALYETALNEAIAYGQALSNDFKSDTRPEVRQHFKRTFSIVAWDDPATAGGIASEVVGYDAKVTLATELNEAILKHQGLPAHPALETLYRHTAACVTQLGLLGVGSAAFADMSKEFLDA